MTDPTAPASPPAEPPQAPTPPAAAQPTPAAAQPTPAAAQPSESKAARRTREVIAAKARGLNDDQLLAWMRSEADNADSELDADTLVAEAVRIADKSKHPDD